MIYRCFCKSLTIAPYNLFYLVKPLIVAIKVSWIRDATSAFFPPPKSDGANAQYPQMTSLSWIHA